jgi:membrane protease YdiL (CAAX protease family)
MATGERTRDWASLAEALAVFLLIMGYIWWLRLDYPWLWAPMLGLVAATHWARREGGRRLGFGWREFKAALWPVVPGVMAMAMVLLGIGMLAGSARQTSVRQALPGLVLYILWGLFQQYLLNAYFVNRLLEFSGSARGRLVPLWAALLFSFAHLPNWFLVLVTFAGGYLSAAVYLRYRSLYVLGLAHGVIGFALYLVVPDSISAHFVIGPRYLLDRYGIYPEFLL